MAQPIELKPMGSSTSKSKAPDAQPGTLGSGYRTAEDAARAALRPVDGTLDAASIFGLASAGWFSILALPLLVFPRLIIFLSQPSGPPTSMAAAGIPNYDRDHFDALTPLEGFLVQVLGLGLVALALLSLFVVVPTYAPPTATPGRTPAIIVLTLLASVVSVIAYNSPVGALAILVGLGHAAMAAWGWWVVVFGNERKHIGKILKRDSRLKRL